MPSLEIPAISGPNRHQERRIMYMNVRIMFWLGYWPETAEYDLRFYIQDFNPRLFQWILRHPRLEQGLSFLRRVNPWISLIYVCIQVVMVHPFAIYLNYDNKHIVVDNASAMVLWMFTLGVTSCCLFRKEGFNSCIMEMEKYLDTLYKEISLDDKLRSKIKRVYNYNNNFTKCINCFLIPMIMFSSLIYCLVWCVSLRNQIFRGWYPYDDKASPAYEITMIANMVFIIFNMVSGTSVTTIAIFAMIYARVFLMIIVDQLKKIQITSERNIYKSKLVSTVYDRLDQNAISLTGISREVKTPALLNTSKIGEIPDFSIQGKYLREFPMQVQGCAGFTNIRGNLRPNNRNRVRFKRGRRKLIINDRMAKGNIQEGERSLEFTAKNIELEMHNQLRKLVQLHQRVLSISKKWSNLLAYYFTSFFLVNIMTYGVIILIVSNIDVLNIKEILIVFTFFEIIGLFFILNVLANMLTDESAAVGEALYASDWLGASTSFKRSMLIVMTRARIPVEFKTLGVEPLSLKLFGEVSNKAYKMSATIIDVNNK